MIYRTKDLLKKYKSDFQISKLVKEGKLFKIGYGLYSDEQYDIADVEKIFIKFNNATLCNESAFSFHDLTDFIPDQYHVATSNNSHKINSDKVIQHYVGDRYVKVGRKKVFTDYGYIYVFDKERSLIDLIRHKNKYPKDYFKEILNSYRRLLNEDQIDRNKVLMYCDELKLSDNAKETIEDYIL